MNTRVFSLTLILLILLTMTLPMVVQTHASDITVQLDANGNPVVSSGGKPLSTDSTTAWNDFLDKYKKAISGISGVAAITFVVFFIIQFMKLGASAGNPMQRSQALSGVLWTGLAATGLGGVSVFFTFFYTAIS